MQTMRQLKDVPSEIVNPNNSHALLKGTFLGKGGFGRCYELSDTKTHVVYAGKIVAKALLQRKKQKEQMIQEIALHGPLSHPHIVRLYDFFEDTENVYMLLELCSRKSLMELHKRRKIVTEPEARYFTSQVVSACEYLHKRHIVHRDLKLGNLFLNSEMQVKVGDFGLAASVKSEDERRTTFCGTPNYMAPEILGDNGHSYEVDIWAIGCILYALLVGIPPFETMSLKETCQKIKNNHYSIPSRIGAEASNLIHALLAATPSQRPTIFQIAEFDFFAKGFMPSRLPTSCLTVAPKFTAAQLSYANDKPVPGDLKAQDFCITVLRSTENLPCAPPRPLALVPELQEDATVFYDAQSQKASDKFSDVPADFYLADLQKQLVDVVDKKPSERELSSEDEAEDPAAVPVYWVSRWVEYSEKYGFGYELCDNSTGVLFNDETKIVLDAPGEQVQYTDDNSAERYFRMSDVPSELKKKVSILKYFRGYMQRNLQKTGAGLASQEGDELARLPYVRTWYRTQSAIVFHMSNGTLQINFFKDHVKFIVCPLMGAVTFIENHRLRTLKLDLLKIRGCPKQILSKLKYARMTAELLMKSPNLTFCNPSPQ